MFKNKYKELNEILIKENTELKEKILSYEDDSLQSKSTKANIILNNLGVASHTESGKQIRQALALELLGAEYDMIDKYSKSVFIKTQGAEVMLEVRKLLQEEGVLSRKGRGIEHKK